MNAELRDDLSSSITFVCVVLFQRFAKLLVWHFAETKNHVHVWRAIDIASYSFDFVVSEMKSGSQPEADIR